MESPGSRARAKFRQTCFRQSGQENPTRGASRSPAYATVVFTRTRLARGPEGSRPLPASHPAALAAGTVGAPCRSRTDLSCLGSTHNSRYTNGAELRRPKSYAPTSPTQLRSVPRSCLSAIAPPPRARPLPDSPLYSAPRDTGSPSCSTPASNSASKGSSAISCQARLLEIRTKACEVAGRGPFARNRAS